MFNGTFYAFYDELKEIKQDTYFSKESNIIERLEAPNTFLLESVLFHIAGQYYLTLGYSEAQALEAAINYASASYIVGKYRHTDDSFYNIVLPDGYELGSLFLFKNGIVGIQAGLYNEESDEYIIKRYTLEVA